MKEKKRDDVKKKNQTKQNKPSEKKNIKSNDALGEN